MNVIAPLTTNKTTVAYSRASIASTRDRGGNFDIVASNELRFNHFLDPLNSNIDYFAGVLIEPRRTNYLRNTASSLIPGVGQPIMVTSQTVNLGTITPENLFLTLSFFGNGTVTVDGGGYSYTLTGTADSSSPVPPHITFPCRSSVLLVTVTGQVYAANLEGAGASFGSQTDPQILTAISRPTSWIPTTSSEAVRQADVIDASGVLFNEFIENTLEYDPIVEYNLLDRVKYQDTIWQSSSDANTGNVPSVSSNSWVKVQTVNNLALLDLAENSNSTAVQGEQGTRFVYVVKPGTVEYSPSSILKYTSGLFTDACAVEVRAKVSELTVSISTSVGVFTKTTVNDNYETANLVSGLEEELRKFNSTAGVTGGVQVYYCTVSVRLHNGMTSDGDMAYPDSEVKIGELVIGRPVHIGKTAYGMRAGIINYGKKETNEFGVTTFIQRSFSKKLSCSVYVENEDYNTVVDVLQSLLSSPTVWIATDDDTHINSSVIYGAYRDFTMMISYPSYAMLDIEIEGLVV